MLAGIASGTPQGEAEFLAKLDGAPGVSGEYGLNARLAGGMLIPFLLVTSRVR